MWRGGRGGRGGGGHGRAKPAFAVSTAMQETFSGMQIELDERHDRYERVVKLDRDARIESKRIIFMLQRVTNEQDKGAFYDNAFSRLEAVRQGSFGAIADELDGLDQHEFLRAYSAGLQEFIEAFAFYTILRDERLVDWHDVRLLFTFPQPGDEAGAPSRSVGAAERAVGEAAACRRLAVPLADYLLGIGDVGGELLRFAINSVSIDDLEAPRRALALLRALYSGFLLLGRTVPARDFSQKTWAMRNSLLKVERALYVLHVRSSELSATLLSSEVAACARITDDNHFDL